MNFEHQPGKFLQVDFAGAPLHYAELSTVELISCTVFIAVSLFSGYGYYAEALPNAKLNRLVKALNNTLKYYGWNSFRDKIRQSKAVVFQWLPVQIPVHLDGSFCTKNVKLIIFILLLYTKLFYYSTYSKCTQLYAYLL